MKSWGKGPAWPELVYMLGVKPGSAGWAGGVRVVAKSAGGYADAAKAGGCPEVVGNLQLGVTLLTDNIPPLLVFSGWLHATFLGQAFTLCRHGWHAVVLA